MNMEYNNYFSYTIYNQQIHQKQLQNNFPHALNLNYQQFQQYSPQQHFHNYRSILNHSKSLSDEQNQSEKTNNPDTTNFIPIQYQQYPLHYHTFKKHFVYKQSKSMSESDPKAEDNTENLNF